MLRKLIVVLVAASLAALAACSRANPFTPTPPDTPSDPSNVETYTFGAGYIPTGSEIVQVPAGALVVTVDPANIKPSRGSQLGVANDVYIPITVEVKEGTLDPGGNGFTPMFRWVDSQGNKVWWGGGLCTYDNGYVKSGQKKVCNINYHYTSAEDVDHLEIHWDWGLDGGNGYVVTEGQVAVPLVQNIPIGYHK